MSNLSNVLRILVSAFYTNLRVFFPPTQVLCVTLDNEPGATTSIDGTAGGTAMEPPPEAANVGLKLVL